LAETIATRPRWAQNSSISPILPLLSRKQTSGSPISLTRTGGQSGSGISLDSKERRPIAAQQFAHQRAGADHG